MARYRLKLEYDGRGFVGWQRQDNGLGVQEAVEDAVYAFTGERAQVFAAGRTDAGVHALGQVGHVDLEKDWPADTVRNALNFHLKAHAVSVVAAAPVDEDFHARFSAVSRSYLYRVLNRRSPPALDRGMVWWVPVPLDAGAMAAAARVLIGHHDFTSFRATHCQANSPVKTLDALDVTLAGEEIHFRAHARSFLHHQVRNMVGSLKWVGEGRWTAKDLQSALDARDRAAGGPTAPPDGLYLTDVGY
ncbi:tRNA pseudouridine(38-40) synthase TruA [Thalassospiraceae bacterium LMO-SO8]|jgi:tRNA pseudouridine38-40 synthase|nr:tRNA pseudouridine(38-40) synthase TruA [Alphaproteobacteria bacterium LMO-S08]WND77275.1 tRNA pseudouridine(38-40) synthase TruA [Thalassospiraceae bacterium LMO-SO8]